MQNPIFLQFTKICICKIKNLVEKALKEQKIVNKFKQCLFECYDKYVIANIMKSNTWKDFVNYSYYSKTLCTKVFGILFKWRYFIAMHQISVRYDFISVPISFIYFLFIFKSHCLPLYWLSGEESYGIGPAITSFWWI